MVCKYVYISMIYAQIPSRLLLPQIASPGALDLVSSKGTSGACHGLRIGCCLVMSKCLGNRCICWMIWMISLIYFTEKCVYLQFTRESLL